MVTTEKSQRYLFQLHCLFQHVYFPQLYCTRQDTDDCVKETLIALSGDIKTSNKSISDVKMRVVGGLLQGQMMIMYHRFVFVLRIWMTAEYNVYIHMHGMA